MYPFLVTSPSVKSLDEGRQVLGHQVDHILSVSFIGRDGDALLHRLFEPFGVPAPLVGNAPGKGEHIVHDLLVHGGGNITAGAGHRMGRPDVGSRRHCRDVGGGRDENPGRSRLGTAGRDVDHDGDLGIEYGLGRCPSWKS